MIKLLYILLFAVCTLHANSQDLLSYRDSTGLKKLVTTFEAYRFIDKILGHTPPHNELNE